MRPLPSLHGTNVMQLYMVGQPESCSNFSSNGLWEIPFLVFFSLCSFRRHAKIVGIELFCLETKVKNTFSSALRLCMCVCVCVHVHPWVHILQNSINFICNALLYFLFSSSLSCSTLLHPTQPDATLLSPILCSSISCHSSCFIPPHSILFHDFKKACCDK